MMNLDNKMLQILELSRDIIYMVELKPELKMIYINSAVTEKLGISVEENYTNPNRAFESTHIDDREKFKIKVNDELDYSKPIEVRYQHINGEYIWFEESVIPIYSDTKELIALVGFCRDIQERKEMEEKLQKLTFCDCLTGIKNRTFFEREREDLNTITNTQIGMVIFDLDNLKYINDSFGHVIGDQLLKEFAKILDKYTNEDIVVARIGGDEFVLLAKNKSYKWLEDICFELQISIGEYNLKNKTLPIKVSMGIGYCETSIGRTQWVYNMADSKMYEDKAANKTEFTSSIYKGDYHKRGNQCDIATTKVHNNCGRGGTS